MKICKECRDFEPKIPCYYGECEQCGKLATLDNTKPKEQICLITVRG